MGLVLVDEDVTLSSCVDGAPFDAACRESGTDDH